MLAFIKSILNLKSDKSEYDHNYRRAAQSRYEDLCM